MPTIRDVARASGVSPMTVSYVLNNPGRVHKDTRARVMAAMRDIGYRAAVREEEADQRRWTLGVVYSRWRRLPSEVFYYSRLVDGLLWSADDLGIHVTLFSHHTWNDPAHRSLRVYCDGRCDGLIVFAPKKHSDLVAALRDRGMPFVLVGDTGDEPGDACVDVDSVAAARDVTNHLLDLGHRHIAYLAGEEDTRTTEERAQGWREAHAARGLTPDPALILPGDFSPESGYERVKELLRRPAGPNRPTALFCVNDAVALGALQAARDAGLRIPEDLSLAGFDDVPDAATSDPPLTTVSQPYREIGERAVTLLTACISGEPGSRVLLPGNLIFRQSSGPAPRTA